jgi:DNA-binding CsgD family transcriptional regulator
MIRAFGLAQKLGATLRLGDDLAGVLDLSPYGLVLLDAAGRIRHLNRAANTLISEPGGLSAMGGRLTAHRADAARTLQALIARAAAAESRAGGSMALAAPGRRLPLSITIVPLQSPRWSVFHDGPTVLVCVTDLEAGVSLPEHRLRDLFALTGAESRLALALLEGASPKEAALRLGISANTAKVHLARVFAKTRVNRQSELIALMMRAVGVRLD